MNTKRKMGKKLTAAALVLALSFEIFSGQTAAMETPGDQPVQMRGSVSDAQESADGTGKALEARTAEGTGKVLEARTADGQTADGQTSDGQTAGEQNPDGQNPEDPTQPGTGGEENPPAQGKQVKKISVSKKLTGVYGDRLQLTAQLVDAAGKKVTEGTIAVQSANPSIALVEEDASGKVWVRAAGVGDTTITVTSAETEHYLAAEAVVAVHFDKAAQTITASSQKKTYGFSPYRLPVKATGGKVTYEVISGSGVIKLKADGTVSGKKTGEAKIKITAPESAYYKKAEKEITFTVQTSLAKGTFQNAKIVKKGIQVKWKKITGAQAYDLWRKDPSSSEWKKIKTGTGLKYLDKNVKAGEKYYYRIKAYAADGKDRGEAGETKKMTYLLAPQMSITLAPTGNQLVWSRPLGTGGYRVYRRTSSKEAWKKVKTLEEPGEVSWRDTTAKNGTSYSYTVTAYDGDAESLNAAAKSYLRLSPPSVKSWKRKPKKMTLSWKKNGSASGYQVQYAKNSMFASPKTVTLNGAGKLSYTVSGLKKKDTCYMRVRAFKKKGGKTWYSAWSASSNIKETRTLETTILAKDKKAFEIRAMAGQEMYQYDTLQGSCTDGTYAYYLLYNRNVLRCKIVKVKMSNLKVAKVSEALSVAHGNDMAYDSAKKRLVIVHSTGSDPKMLTSVNPKTLKVIESKHIQIPNKLSDGSLSDAKNATAFSGLAYSAGRKQFAVLLSHNYNFVVLDADLDPVRYVKVSKKNNYTVQGIDATDDYILLAQSPKSSGQEYNILTVYDWDGNYISMIKVRKKYEIESVYHVGSTFYAGFYCSYNRTGYKNVVKNVTENGKTVKKKVKVKYTEYTRSNYVYRIKVI